jgi:hypothetical protein
VRLQADEPDHVHRTSTNGAANVAAFPPVWATAAATAADRALVVRVLAKVQLRGEQMEGGSRRSKRGRGGEWHFVSVQEAVLCLLIPPLAPPCQKRFRCT